jgi:hypothetical protein
VTVEPVALSFSVAVAQSYCTVSGHVWRYQNESVPPAVGTVNVWLTEESPLVGPVDPSRAAYVPVCGAVTTPVVPALDHPDSVPVSNPGLVTGVDGGGGGGGADAVGVTGGDACDAGPSPLAFVAVTVKV